CQIGFDGMLAGTISADQAYDESVFYLAPSNLATITTVNVADLIVGPDSMAPSDASRLAEDESIDTDYALQKNAEITNSLDSLDMHLEAAPLLKPMSEQQQQQQTVAEDPNKRRMEEAFVERISNDLGSEHMAGLFKSLKGSGGQSALDEDEDMEVDLT
ncbi:hypothetical protein BGZ75_006330, partial [Mortierella antarctica]